MWKPEVNRIIGLSFANSEGSYTSYSNQYNMTKKDPNVNENIDRDKNAKEDWESHHTTTERYPEEAKGIGETDVKNAHASGDGAYGRNETGVGEEKEEAKDDDTEESPY